MMSSQVTVLLAAPSMSRPVVSSYEPLSLSKTIVAASLKRLSAICSFKRAIARPAARTCRPTMSQSESAITSSVKASLTPFFETLPSTCFAKASACSGYSCPSGISAAWIALTAGNSKERPLPRRTVERRGVTNNCGSAASRRVREITLGKRAAASEDAKASLIVTLFSASMYPSSVSAASQAGRPERSSWIVLLILGLFLLCYYFSIYQSVKLTRNAPMTLFTSRFARIPSLPLYVPERVSS